MKSKVVLFVTGYILLIFSSCLNSDEVEYEISRDPQIASFTLSHDSISGLSDVKFVIDQVNGLIYNGDSLPFGTDINQKLWASITFSTAVTEVEIHQQATGDTIFWTGNSEKDSINFTKPLDIKTKAMDNFTTKRYLAKLNVHQVMPDTMEWKLFQQGFVDGAIKEQKVVAFQDGFLMYSVVNNIWDVQYAPFNTPDNWLSKTTNLPIDVKVSQMLTFAGKLWVPGNDGTLYGSVDGQNWTQELSGVYVGALLGSLTEKTLSIVIQEAGDSYFATIDGNLELTQANKIPDDFPLDELNPIAYEVNHKPTLLIIGGTREEQFIQKIWNTTNGLTWETYENIELPYRRGASVIKYDGINLYLIGGFDKQGNPSRDIFISPNYGVAWRESGTLVALPEQFTKRGFSSVVVDNENYIYIFGGKQSLTSGNVLDELWRGRINRLGFAIQ